MNGKEGQLVLVNGAVLPTLRPTRGLLRLRLVNASNARYYRLALEDHSLYLVATDGGLIEKPIELEELLLAPGERAEVLVRLEGAGSFALTNRPYACGVMTRAVAETAAGNATHSMSTMARKEHESRPEIMLILSAPRILTPLPYPSL